MKPWQQTLMDFAAEASKTTPRTSQKATALFVKAVYYWLQGNPVWSALIGKANVAPLDSGPFLITLDESGSMDNEMLRKGLEELMNLPLTEIN